ncbi:hypothetical protein BO79DRAFT_286823 [Aspergillus costaricaensis CBS 115574]|uniref:Uncharacterized protein n=1 Tax=Aspergillus costaricaensis CBS 115574 TaxID=1448317 RepID=A0ACD1IGZ8_9EURO|nr:hypothetical protein BO79DRAFT_286823 [Aspergillus costaricaensis CBS 115574]RAK89836.1 hypothetical protein BO79DRAFT_286823 [Aspergillus costaricaensis CBS 115574]
MPDMCCSDDALYASGGKGSMRYLFLHGGHSQLPPPDNFSVEAKVLVQNTHGEIIFDDSPDQPTSQYQFIDRTLKSVNGKEDAYIPKQLFVEKMLMNVSIPTLLFAEIPRDHADTPSSENVSYVTLLILGRTGMEQASFQDYEYLKSMLHLFVPRFGRAISRMSDVYLPGDALNLSHEVAGYMMVPSGDTNNLRTFLAMYAKRYMLKSSSEREVLERCLLHMLKMPFELSSAIRYGLILY